MTDRPALLQLPNAQTGEVRVDSAAGRDVVRQGVNGDQVVDLLGRRLERHLERIAGSLTLFVAVAAFQTAVLLLVAVLAAAALLDPETLAELGILKNLISVRF